ncbi:DMT family transporter [Microvirga brassicacearum]|uniref:DMT family transporter n=1 Tax=Microvirga brassicacearum TaxID=2580413 RepID=A0A5N3PH06_9HYPH|nr:DMT family transporter [Microvirga brassicacearum]KAB0268935.1 DMT family transporter [Microvirga brassicacearum]
MSATPTTDRLESSLAPAFVALCVGAVAMGISPIFVRFAAADVGPFASAFWRVALSLPVVYAWMVIEEKRAPVDAPRRSYTRATVLAGLAFSGDLFFWHLSILNTTVANATFFATTAPLFVILIVWFVLKQRISRGTIVGLLFCLLGGGALIGQSLQVDPARIRGDLFGVATAFFFGLYFLAVGRARDNAGAARVTFEAGMVTSAVLLVIALLFDTRVIPHTWQGTAALTAMAFISQAGGQGLLAIALGRLPPVFSSLVIFLEAIAAAVFGWLILNEALTLIQSLGGALILIGIWAARPRSHAPVG